MRSKLFVFLCSLLACGAEPVDSPFPDPAPDGKGDDPGGTSGTAGTSGGDSGPATSTSPGLTSASASGDQSTGTGGWDTGFDVTDGSPPSGDFGCTAFCEVEVGCFADFWESHDECVQWCTSVPTDETCGDAWGDLVGCLEDLSCDELGMFWEGGDGGTCAAQDAAVVDACDALGTGDGGSGSFTSSG